MAIIYSPKNTSLLPMATCAICNEEKPLSVMSAGLVDAESNQAFACESHYSEFRRMVIGWVDFAIEQRHSQQKHDIDKLFDGGN